LDLVAQKEEVREALRRLDDEQTAREAPLHASASGNDEDRQRAFDSLVENFQSKERRILEPLAAGGNAEAQYRLSMRMRDADSPDEVRRWFELLTSASALGHPQADEELVRWYWHQQGDGSIQQVQANRARAFAHAERAVDQGHMLSLVRIATYVVGDVHQYPANPGLARRLYVLCARADYDPCQERLVGSASGLSATESYVWLARLAAKRPASYAAAAERAFARVAPEEQAAAKAQAERWRPATWPALKGEWEQVRRDILAFGETSIGQDVPCTTMAPWCRGAFVRDIQALR
jgi:hypothetical protein